MNSRNMLKSAGCFLMLPALESFGQEATGDDAGKANRLFCMNIGNGMCSDNFPTSTGKGYQSSSPFKPLEKLKDDFTLCTNLRNYGNHESTMYAFAEYADHTNFEHGKHIKFNGTDNRNNVYLAALQHLGLEIERFATSSGCAQI